MSSSWLAFEISSKGVLEIGYKNSNYEFLLDYACTLHPVIVKDTNWLDVCAASLLHKVSLHPGFVGYLVSEILSRQKRSQISHNWPVKCGEHWIELVVEIKNCTSFLCLMKWDTRSARKDKSLSALSTNLSALPGNKHRIVNIWSRQYALRFERAGASVDWWSQMFQVGPGVHVPPVDPIENRSLQQVPCLSCSGESRVWSVPHQVGRAAAATDDLT